MLPLPMIRAARPAGLRSWLRRVDDYTLWAFNTQRPLGRR